MAYVIKAAADSLGLEDKKLAFILTLELLAANGKFAQEEKQFVNDLAGVLQIDQQWVENTSEIIMLKYS